MTTSTSKDRAKKVTPQQGDGGSQMTKTLKSRSERPLSDGDGTPPMAIHADQRQRLEEALIREAQRTRCGDGGLVETQLGSRHYHGGSNATSPVVCSSVKMQLELHQRNSAGEHRIQLLRLPPARPRIWCSQASLSNLGGESPHHSQASESPGTSGRQS